MGPIGTFPGKQEECDLCQLMKTVESINQDLVFPFFKYGNKNNSIFACALCSFKDAKRGCLSKHIKAIHQSDILANQNKKYVTKEDCGNLECKTLYGIREGKKFWCKKCTTAPELEIL